MATADSSLDLEEGFYEKEWEEIILLPGDHHQG